MTAHPFITLAIVIGAGLIVSSVVARPDPHQIGKQLGKGMAPLLAGWAAARQWGNEMAPAAGAKLEDMAAALPPRRWWDDQFEQIRDMISKRLSRLTA